MNDALFSTGKNDWETPIELFNELDNEFHFTLDPCCSENTAKCDKFYTEETDGLSKDWTGEIVFCNPPYSSDQQGKWVKKCYEHALNGGLAVMLIPARTDTRRFHEYIYGKAEIRFLAGRLKFGNAPNPAPFPSMVVIFRNILNNVRKYEWDGKIYQFILTKTGWGISLEDVCAFFNMECDSFTIEHPEAFGITNSPYGLVVMSDGLYTHFQMYKTQYAIDFRLWVCNTIKMISIYAF